MRVGVSSASPSVAPPRSTRIYCSSIIRVLRAGVPVHAMAHITGGGITENLDRVLPADTDANVVRDSWKVPRIVEVAVEAAGLSADDAYKTFNMGIGYVLVLDAKDAPRAAALLREAGERVFEIGEIVSGDGKVVYV